MLIFWPVAAIIRYHYGWKLKLEPWQKRLRLAMKIICLVDVACAVIFLGISSTSDPVALLSGKLDPLLLFCQVLGVMGAVGTLLVIYAAFRLRSAPNLWTWARVFNFVTLLACLGFTWFVFHWNLINFNLRY